MPFVAPSAPATGLQPYGHNNPMPPRGKPADRSKKTRPRGRNHLHEGHMSKFDEMLEALQQAVVGAAGAPEGERDGLLKTSIKEFGEAISGAIAEEREDAFSEGLNENFAKFAEEQGLAKNMGHVAEMAGQLRSMELMLDRLANEADGKSPWGGNVGTSFDAGRDQDPEHAARLHDLIEPWYGLGVRLLVVMTAMEAGEEMSDMDDDDRLMIEEDVARLRAGVGAPAEKMDSGDLRKFGAPETGNPGQADPAAQQAQEPQEPMDAAETLKRLLAAAMVVADAIQNVDGAEDEGEFPEGEGEEGLPEEGVEGQEDPEAEGEGMPEGEGEEEYVEAEPREDAEAEGEEPEDGGDDRVEADKAKPQPKRRPPPFTKNDRDTDMRKLHAEEVAEAAQADIQALQKMVADLTGQVDALRKGAPATPKGVARVITKADDAGQIGGADESAIADKLSKMDETGRRIALIKISQGVPLDRI